MIYLIAESNAGAEANPSGDQHAKVLRHGVQNRAHDKENRGSLDGDFAAKSLASNGSKEGSHNGCQVERRCEKLKELVVVFAVVVFFHVVLLGVNDREKLYQEVVH